MKPYPLVEDLGRLVPGVAMPRAPRVVAPGGTIHVVARYNNREFYFSTAEDFDLLLAHLHHPGRASSGTLLPNVPRHNGEHSHFGHLRAWPNGRQREFQGDGGDGQGQDECDSRYSPVPA